MGLHSRLQALKHYIWHVPTIEDKSPEELTSRAERAILDNTSEKSTDSILEAKEGKVRSSSSSAGGLDCAVRNLYQDKAGLWTEKIPYHASTSAENETTTGYALIVRNRQALDSRKKFEIESLVVQSPLLKRALNTIFKDYPGIVTDVDRLEFSSPFQPFVHRWHEFEQATVKETHLETKHHLALLWNVLEAELKDLLQKIKDHERHGVIDFATVWTLFEPNALILTDSDGTERLYRCVKGSSDTVKYDIEAQYVDWDGDRFGTVISPLTIKSFRGTKKLTSLSAMPLSRHPKRFEIEKRLLARGKIFQDLKGYHFKDYNGIGIQGSTAARYNVNSRIIIDTSGSPLPFLFTYPTLTPHSLQPHEPQEPSESRTHPGRPFKAPLGHQPPPNNRHGTRLLPKRQTMALGLDPEHNAHQILHLSLRLAGPTPRKQRSRASLRHLLHKRHTIQHNLGPNKRQRPRHRPHPLRSPRRRQNPNSRIRSRSHAGTSLQPKRR